MSHEPFEERDVKNATPEMAREELDKYFTHVQQHDPKTLEFAIMVAGHSKEDGDTHVCSMLSGPPRTLAIVITELMDELVKRDSAFATFFLAHFLRRIEGVDVEIVREGDADGEDAVTQVRNLLAKLRDSTPPSGGIH